MKNIQHRYLHWLSLVDRIQHYVMNIGFIIELLKLFKILVKFKLFFSQFTAGCRQIHALSEMFNHESSITSSIPRWGVEPIITQTNKSVGTIIVCLFWYFPGWVYVNKNSLCKMHIRCGYIYSYNRYTLYLYGHVIIIHINYCTIWIYSHTIVPLLYAYYINTYHYTK